MLYAFEAGAAIASLALNIIKRERRKLRCTPSPYPSILHSLKVTQHATHTAGTHFQHSITKQTNKHTNKHHSLEGLLPSSPALLSLHRSDEVLLEVEVEVEVVVEVVVVVVGVVVVVVVERSRRW